MPGHHDKRHIEVHDCEFNTPFSAFRCDIARNPTHEEGAEWLVEDDFRCDSTVGTGNHARNRLLFFG